MFALIAAVTGAYVGSTDNMKNQIDQWIDRSLKLARIASCATYAFDVYARRSSR